MSKKRVTVKFCREDGRYISPEGVEIGVPDLLANAHHIKGDDGLVLLPLRHPAAVAAVRAAGGGNASE